MFVRLTLERSTLNVITIPEIFSAEKIIDVVEVNQWRWLEESGQWLKMLAEPISTETIAHTGDCLRN